MTSPRALFVDYMQMGKLLQLATSSDGRPWVCHVWYGWDKDQSSVIFMSRRTRRHCLELAANPQVAGAVVAIPLEGLGQRVTGARFEGLATPVAGPELEHVYSLYAERWPQVQRLAPISSLRESAEDGPWFYVVKIGRAVLFDEVHFPDSPRQEFVFNND